MKRTAILLYLCLFLMAGCSAPDSAVSEEAPPQSSEDIEISANATPESDSVSRGEPVAMEDTFRKNDTSQGESTPGEDAGEFDIRSETDASHGSEFQEDIPEITEDALPLAGHIICIDPGHGVTPLTRKNMKGPVSPISEETKPLYTEGTHGANLTEEALNLMVGLKLREKLASLGAKVLITREVSEAAVTGLERCEIANRGNADVHIHLHADGVDDSAAHGVSVLVPSPELLGTPSILEESVRLGELMVDCVAESTGAKNRGTTPRSDLTGLNFSEMPSVFLEMGFMTNRQEDALLETEAYQNQIVDGIVQSLFLWYGLT